MTDQITFRVSDRREFQRRLAELELEYDIIWDAAVWEIHTAICDVALDNPDMLVQKLEDIREE